MLWSNQFSDVIEMVQHVLNSCRLISFDKHPHACDSEDAARLTNLLDNFICLQTWMTGHEMAARMDAGELSAVELATASLERIGDVQPALNCFTEVWEDAVDAARRLDDERARGHVRSPLHGVPVAIKDTTPVAGRLIRFQPAP